MFRFITAPAFALPVAMTRLRVARPAARSLVAAALVVMISGCEKPDGNSATAESNPNGVWKLFDVKDDKLDKTSVEEAETTLTADNGRPFDLAMRCSPGFVTLKLSNYDKGTKFQEDHADNGDPAYFLPVKLDDGDVQNARSEIAYTNEATIFFFDPELAPRAIAEGVSDQYGHALKSVSGNSNNGMNQLAGGLMGMLSGLFSKGLLQVTAAGTVADLVKARRLAVEVPLRDGGKPLLQIDLRDPNLQGFFGECTEKAEKAFPPPKSPNVAASNNAQPTDGESMDDSNRSEPQFQ